METIINQLFWLWVPLSLLPVWLRIAIITYIVVVCLRPIIIRLLPRLIKWGSILLQKITELVSLAFMKLAHRKLMKRRDEGNYVIPAWVDVMEDSVAFLLKGFMKTEQLFKKRTRNKYTLRKTFRITALLLAIILPMAIINNPTTTYSKSWYQFEKWASEEKVKKALGFDLSDLQGKVGTTLKQVEGVEYTLKEQYEEGGNIRETPSLDGNIVDSLKLGETVTYLEEEETDNRGITWLKVKTADGKEGWISANIVVKA
ncbi:SH3 domain-containing protein [Metabacillus niabensis]|uniref:SH3b domain-containing protein n=1 Tax=Metabacillus niabensis TaxID=324854 RepID=A0ABT9Z4K8_9BACI|nr:SH3 domain-containing protein [Metabacillus niabensis]MDQ0227203.1 hypothetical protein [Metabacillus niabensis]